jgi:hypothetical protein
MINIKRMKRMKIRKLDMKDQLNMKEMLILLHKILSYSHYQRKMNYYKDQT